jgi:transcriptional regulator of acetoin/glycerol metabolism
MIYDMVGETTAPSGDSSDRSRAEGAAPGLVLVFSGQQPQLTALPVDEGVLVLGRGEQLPLEDTMLSRRHAQISRNGNRFLVRDLQSRNGTFVDGERVSDALWARTGAAIRLGGTILLTCADINPYAAGSVVVSSERVLGIELQAVWAEIARLAESHDCLHVQGETGSGKELVARQFHRAGRHGDGPFVAVNCATIPPLLAERLLFGARKGAYSGADADTEGYLQAADGGTLFLDEVADLGPEVQAKLLRVIETREVLPLGATRPRHVSVRLCSAAHRDLRQEVALGRFRQDLYYRIARPTINLPPLRERRAELPWLAAWILKRANPDLTLHVTAIEEVMLRPWPGNVRELSAEIVTAAAQARAQGSTQLKGSHLSASAGRAIESPARPNAAPDRAGIIRALEENGGRVASAARALGMHRTQLRRLIARHQIDPNTTRKG